MQWFHNKNQLFDFMAHAATVLTPNKRLSAVLQQQYIKNFKINATEKPRCLPYTDALKLAFDDLVFQYPELNHPILISSGQYQHLWRRLIQSHPRIQYSEGLLQEVMQAWEQCQQWQINQDHPAFKHRAQTQQFQDWWQIFQQQLRSNHLITEHQLCAYLIQSGLPCLSSPIIWVCFDNFSPAQLNLQQHLNQLGIEQLFYDLPDSETNPKLLAAENTEEEYQQLLAWLQQKIQDGEQKIAVVIPELHQQWQPLERLLQNYFDPALVDVSLGKSLAEFPLIAHALTWLQLNTQSLTRHQAILLLQSPYLAHATEEFSARSQYVQDSSILQNHRFALSRFIQSLNAQAPLLASSLKKLCDYPEKAPVQQWIELFQERLNALGFPGDSGLNSENHQCFNRFVAVFDEFRQIALISPELSAQEALYVFEQLARDTIFQTQKTQTCIQISGLLEASGCEFDSLWLTGLHDQCLPQKVRFSAFIPLQLQRDLKMPHSSANRELLLAAQILKRLQRGSKELVFSYPRLQGDRSHLPCVLIADTEEFQRVPIVKRFPEPQLIHYEEHYRLPLDPNEQLSGNTALLANQAKCPFKAFAEHRLKAKPEPETVEGLDIKKRGQVLHKAMELLWNALKSQENLLKLTPWALECTLQKALDAALQALEPNLDSFPKLAQEVEYLRLKKIALQSLEWEKNRPSFEISALEQSYSIPLAGLDFQVRIDRLDQVSDKKWVIDYKSTLPASKPWLEERPKEPQLLFYALLDEQINTLVLLELKTRATVCSGLSAVAQEVPGISPLKNQETWEEQKIRWHNQLSLLAEEFQQGQCLPQPANLSLCQYCDFQNLCRFQAIE